ncbi:MAG: HAD hydrolase-like protein [Aquificae bacterium]|nr:HAD hydrolase-like protein [Aquificota bacterium]
MRAVIFDVDGVIVDVRDSYHHAIKKTVEHFTGISLPLEEIREFKFSRGINNDWDVSLELIKKLGKEPPPYGELVDVFESFYDELKDREKLILGRDFFKELKDRGVLLGIVTGRPKRDLSYLFERFSLWEFFDAVVDDDDVGDISLRKPHPYPLEMCMGKLSAGEALYVGDNRADWRMVRDYNRMHGERVGFVHFKKVSDEELPAIFATDDEGELLRFLIDWVR